MQHTSGISEGKAIIKEGKLIRVKAKFDNDVIKSIRITGDFFLHPEEAIEDIEKTLIGSRIGEVHQKLKDAMKNMEYEGISPESLTKAIEKAWMRRS